MRWGVRHTRFHAHIPKSKRFLLLIHITIPPTPAIARTTPNGEECHQHQKRSHRHQNDEDDRGFMREQMMFVFDDNLLLLLWWRRRRRCGHLLVLERFPL